MYRDENCGETIFGSHLFHNCPHHGGNFERGKNALSCGRETVTNWEAFQDPRDNSGEDNCESKIVSRENFCRETSRCLAGSSGERSEKRSETGPKILRAPLRPLKNISPALF